MSIKKVPPVSGEKVIKYTSVANTTPSTGSVDAVWGSPTSTDPDIPSDAAPWPTTIVGTGSVLQDGSDATYVVTQRQKTSSGEGTQIVTFPISVDVPVDEITSISYSFRAKVDKTGGALDGSRPWMQFAADPDFVGDIFRIPADAAYVYDGSTFEVTHTLTTADEVTSAGGTLDEVKGWLAAGTGVFAVLAPESNPSSPNGSAVTQTLYELTVTVGFEGPPEVEDTVITLLGPSTPEQGDSGKHRGKFAINQNTNQYSAWLRVGTTDADIWVVPVVSFFQIDPSGSTEIGVGQQTLTALGVPAAPEWHDINIYGKTPDGATHYSISMKMFSDSTLTTPLADGTNVYYDAIFVPESGYDLRDGTQPYLDGDQSFGIWEGTVENSTSVYGTKPGPNLSQTIVLDDDLPIYSATTS